MKKDKPLTEWESFMMFKIEKVIKLLKDLKEDKDMINLNDNIKCINDLTSGELGLDEQGEK